MRRKKRRNKDVIIDLTSLLDIVFIVLLVVICYASTLNFDNQLKASEWLNKETEYDNKAQTYQEMIKEMDDLKEFVGYVVIRIPYDKSDMNGQSYRNRVIHVLEKGENEIKTYEIQGNKKISEQSDLYKYLEDYIAQYGDKPIVISLNDKDEDILYRDEKELNELVDKLQEEHGNIYRK